MAGRTRFATLTLLALAALLPLWRGGVPAPAVAAALAVSAAALCVAWDGRSAPGRAWLAPALLLALAALQCVPLPAGLLKGLAPVSFELRGAPAWAPSSLDVPATLASLAVLGAMACAAAASSAAARDRRARTWLLLAPALAALPAALAGAFANRNHAAALATAGALIALGGALDPTLALRLRAILGATAAVCGAATVWTGSRGGAAALALGCVALLAVRRLRWAALGAAAVALVLAASLAPARLLADVKVRSFPGAVRVVGDHWLSGAGRGAYALVSDRHRSVEGDQRFHFVENGPLQLAADVGVPGALAVLAALAWALAGAARRARESALAAGAAVAVGAVLLQNLVDFSLEVAGVAVPLAIAFGALAPRTENAPRPLWARAAAIGAPAALLLAALQWGTLHGAAREGDAFAARTRDASAALPPLLAQAVQLAGRHPADEVIPLAAARALHERGRPREALGWINRALRIDPGSPREHALAAAVLATSGNKAQARLELRLSWANRRYNGINTDQLELAGRIATGLPELLEATPDDEIVRADLAAHLLVNRRPLEAGALARHEQDRVQGRTIAPWFAAGRLHDEERARRILGEVLTAASASRPEPASPAAPPHPRAAVP